MDTSSLVVRTQRGNTSSPISMKDVEFIFIKELEFIKEIEFIVKNLTKKTQARMPLLGILPEVEVTRTLRNSLAGGRRNSYFLRPVL